MTENKKYCITFAGPIGSSKTPIAYFLSQKLNLPIFNNDAIRSEVREDLLGFDQEEFLKRRNQRSEEIFKSGYSFILDASIDRTWKLLKDYLAKYQYDCYVISLDLSKELLIRLYKAKNYDESMESLDRLLDEHELFLKEYDGEILLHINDQSFADRLQIARTALLVKLGKS